MGPAGDQPELKRKRTQSDAQEIPEVSKVQKLDDQPSSSQNLPSNADGDLSLPSLLDFTHANTTSEISLRFDQLGTALLHDYQIVATSGKKKSEYEILELEFYLIKPGSHEDPFTHGSDEQRRSGNWYFHRAPTRSDNSTQAPTAAGAWRTGSRKGMDLTFGNPLNFDDSTLPRNTVTRGGVLLRSIRRVSDGKVTSGPSLLVDEILRATGVDDIPELVNEKWKRDCSALAPDSSNAPSRDPTLYLRRKQDSAASSSQKGLHAFFGGKGPSKSGEKPKVYRSPRIGLDLSHPSIPQDMQGALSHSRSNYIMKRYRFFTRPNLLKAKGQGHTFLGIYQSLLDSGTKESDEKAVYRDVVKAMDMKLPTVVKYLAEYKEGLEKGVLKPFLGSSGKGVTSSPVSFLKLMGILRKYQLTPIETSGEASSK